MKARRIIFISNVLLLVATSSFAQRDRGVPRLPLSESRVVDGWLTDWAAELENIYTAQDFQYELSQDGSNLYLAIRIADYQRQVQVLTRGMTFMINTDGRKRAGQTMVFPVVDRISLRSRITPAEGAEAEEMRRAALQSVRSIQVMSLGHIPDGPIALRNDFGIEAAAQIDEDDVLYIEMSMPLRFLDAETSSSGAIWAYHMKINGVNRPAEVVRTGNSAYGRYARPTEMYGQGRSREEAGHWGQFILEHKKQDLKN